MRTAKECSKPTPSGYTFGVDAARTAGALRDLAAMIESGLIVVQSARVQTLTARAAKGLEFDRVVLVEPAAIVDEHGGVEGLRALYVALTRATKTLVVVHAEPLPDALRPSH